MNNIELLRKLCSIPAPSSDEGCLSAFLIDYVKTHAGEWKCTPQLFSGEAFQDCVMLVFGKPRTAIVAHIDSVGYMVGYNKELVAVGSPRCEAETTTLVGKVAGESVSVKIEEKDEALFYVCNHELSVGTLLTYEPDFCEDGDYIVSPFLDNRVGVLTALRVAETMIDGAIIFSTGEEVSNGNVRFCWRYLYEQFGVQNALISDITWITHGIHYNKGCVVSIKDSRVPRRKYVNRILEIAEHENIQIQREVETAGGSDGGSLQTLPYPINWCFVGAAQEFPHTPAEKIHKNDIESMYKLYNALIEQL